MRIRLTELADTTDDHVRLRNLSGPETHTAVISARGNQRRRRIAWLAEDLLACVGVRDDVSGAGRNAHDDWELVPIWMLSYGINQLLVLDAHKLDAYATDKLIELAGVADLQLWFVTDPSIDDDAEMLDVLDAWPHTTVGEADFREMWLNGTDDTPASSNDEPDHDPLVDVETLPSSDAFTFQADCRRMLEADTFESVDQLYTETRDDALAWLDEQAPVEEHELAAWVVDRMHHHPTVAHMLVVLRAVQAACFRHRHYVKAELDALLGSADSIPDAAAKSPVTYQRLRAYRQPYRPATCTLAAARLDIDTIRRLDVADISDDGRHTTVEIPEPGIPFLKAAKLERLINGAADDDPLFVGSDSERARIRRLTYALTDPISEVGVALVGRQVDRRRPTADRWLHRHGLVIHRLNTDEELT